MYQLYCKISTCTPIVPTILPIAVADIVLDCHPCNLWVLLGCWVCPQGALVALVRVHESWACELVVSLIFDGRDVKRVGILL